MLGFFKIFSKNIQKNYEYIIHSNKPESPIPNFGLLRESYRETGEKDEKHLRDAE